MKLLSILLLLTLSLPSFALTQVTNKLSDTAVELTEEPGWIKLGSVCFSNSANDMRSAMKACQDSANVLQLISNNEIVFQASCRPKTYEERCTYIMGMVLETRAFHVMPAPVPQPQ